MNRIILSVITIAFSLYFFKSHLSNGYSIRAIYSIPELSSLEIGEKINDEFSKINGIHICEISIHSKNVMLEYEENKISYSDIRKIFYKWGCTISNVYYDNLFIYEP